MPQVSIIVPVYNMEQYLDRCCLSLLDQTLDEIEIIFVNDASTDNSIDILRKFEALNPEKIKVIDSAVNKRQGGARNTGIKYSTGDYIGFIDSDDWAEPEMFKELYNKVVKAPYSICYCNYNIRFNEEIVSSVINRTQKIDWVNDDLLTIQRKLLITPSSIWTGIYSRDFFFEKGLEFPEQLFYEDNFLVPLLICNAKSISKLELPLVNYFKGNVSVTRSYNNENFFDRLTTSEMLLNEFYNGSYPVELKEALEFFFIETYLINTSVGCYTRFNPIRSEKVTSIKSATHMLVPNYESNIFLKEKGVKKMKYGFFVYLLLNHKWILDCGFKLLTKINFKIN